ncbi:hypothetical protein RHMOL_Rhmol11G0274500 [Rhododendron molle]|uniref:Uncharacterized protein n=1 Tax=Rhododendron molle TaxID=49168 RepID=A0ACC0LXV1_RHOML|nr:hypothetical protein RHMOL_Rhmol11G0274500 [Rhododendron molle]
MMNFEDRISQLPDEILGTILSLLNIVEAASTCVLSKRWKYLWTHHAKVLHFYFPKILRAIDKVAGDESRVRTVTDKYLHCVNRVIQLHQGPHITDFKVLLYLSGKDSYRDIDEWFSFAIRKSVQRLEVNLCGYTRLGERLHMNMMCAIDRDIRLPCLRYTLADEVCSLIKSPYGLSCIKSLTELSLTCVNITGELVEHFLSNCPLLIVLRVSNSESLVKLKVAGPSLGLKFLEISRCPRLQTVDICAPNLASLICLGFSRRPTPVLVRHAPSLVDLTVSQRERFLNALPAVYFSQLESLTLSFDFSSLDNYAPRPFPELTNLKNLTFAGYAEEEDSFLGWTSLIERAPFLRTFTLQLLSPTRIQMQTEMEPTERRLHRCLEVVKFVGCIDFELLAYFFQRAVALKTIIVDCRHPSLEPWHEFKENESSTELRNHASVLKVQVPSKIEVVISP